MTTFNAGTIEATMDLDTDPFQRGVQLVRAEGRRLSSEKFGVTIDADTGRAVTQLTTLRTLLGDVTGRHVIRVDLQGYGAVNTQVLRMERMLSALERTYTPRVELNGAAQTIAQVELIDARLDALERDRTTAIIDADTTSFNSNVSSSSSRLGALIALGAALAPALIPGLVGATAAAGGLASALGIAGAGLGALAGGVIGNIMQVTGAQAALEQSTQQVASAQAAVDAANVSAAASARGVQAAEQGLADARRTAAQQVAAAEQQLGAAQRGAKYAQDALNGARKEAAERLADYSDQLKGAALDEEAAELAVRRAEVTLSQILADPTASKLDRDEAKQSLAEARFGLDQVRESRDELQVEAKKAREAGVKGDAQVVAARRQYADAQRAVRAAEQALTEARRSGAAQVAAAQQRVADANRSAAVSSSAAAAAAAELAKAQADQARAQETLSTPAALAFAAAIDAVKASWGQFLDLTRNASLGVATQALEIFADILPSFAPLANAAAEGVGRLLDRFDAWVTGGGMDGALDFLTEHAPDMIESLGVILGNLGQWLGNIVVAFEPFARTMMEGLEDLTEGWADWAGQLGEDTAFQDFIDYALEYGPLFLDTLGSMWDALIQIGRAIAPSAGPVLTLLRDAFDAIAGMDPQTLAFVIAAVGAIVALTASPVAGVAIALLGIVSAFSGIADGSPALKRALEPVGDILGELYDWGVVLAGLFTDELKAAWEDVQPTLEDLGAVLRDDLLPELKEFWKGPGGDLLRWLAAASGQQAGMSLRFIANGAKMLAVNMSGILEMFNGTFTGDWDKFWSGLQKTPIGTFLTLTTLWGNLWEGIQDVARDAGTWIADHLWRGDDSLLGRMESGFARAMVGITAIWGDLRRAAGTPIKFVVETLYNDGIRRVVNAIPGVDDLDRVDTSGWPSFAAGGVLPGHSPGRDIHRYVSPTGGVLNLGGGEGILTTRTTDALGGAAGIARLNKWGEQSFAGGGVVNPYPGSTRSTYAGHDGVDLNRPGDNGPDGLNGGVFPYYSATDGRVTTTGYSRGYGNAVFIQSPYGELVYGHSYPGSIQVSPGQTVTAGQQLALVGNTGNSYGAHLHFGFPGGTFAGANSLLDGAGPGLYSGNIGKAGDSNPLAGFMRAIGAVKDFAGAVPGNLKDLAGMGGWGPMLRGAMGSALGDFRGWVNDKIPGPGPMPGGIFDTGGTLMPGHVAVNMGATPEKVLTDAQWRALSGVALTGTGGGLTSADVDRIVDAIERNRSVNVSAPDQATGREVVELLAFELRR